jgi:anti-anti-sigma factor
VSAFSRQFATPGEFGVQLTHGENEVTVVLRGELDLATAPAAERALTLAGDGGKKAIVVDLSGLTFMDSTGLRLVLALHRRCQAEPRKLVIRPGPPAVQRVFEVTNVEEILPFSGSA